MESMINRSIILLFLSLSAFSLIIRAQNPSAPLSSINYDGNLNKGTKEKLHNKIWYNEEVTFDIALGLLLGFGSLAGLNRARNRKKLSLI